MQNALLSVIQEGKIKSAHDCSDGGLAIAIAECCISDREKQIGATIKMTDYLRTDCLLFGETQSRVVLSCDSQNEKELIEYFRKDDMSCTKIGTTGGNKLVINDFVSVELEKMSGAFFDALPLLMEKVA